jgi:1-acylglycerone phosphate reductase
MSIYGASKAALTIFSETLRVEMTPFGVNVVTVITGIVETNIMNNSLALEIPLNSRYAVAQKEILDRAQGKDVGSHMKSADYAERVVGDLLSGANGKIYRGQMASVVRYSSGYLPISIIVSVCGVVVKNG